MEKRKLRPEQMELNTCLDKANRAIDLAIKELVKINDGDHFKETGRQQRVGKIRPVDLVMSCHFTSETQEMFVVVDLKGILSEKNGGRHCGQYARFEAWCRLFYSPKSPRWNVHYVDIIIRHKSPAERALFMFEYDKSGDVLRATEEAPDKLCLFFETPQGGMWG